MKKKFGADWDNRKKDLVFWSAVVLVVVTAIWINFFSGESNREEYTKSILFSSFIHQTKAGEIKSVQLARGNYNNDRLLVTRKDGQKYSVNYPTYETSITDLLIDKQVDYEVVPRPSPSSLLATMIQITSLLMFAMFIYFILKSTKMFDNSHVKRFNAENDKRMTFSDVAGVDEAKDSLIEIVEFLKNPVKFAHLGGRAPKGALLFGDPGNGKTLLARAVAGEANVPFFAISGSDFVEMFVGVGVMRVKNIFATAKKNAPCIIFIDEIDSLGRTRGGANIDSAGEERASTLNRFLVEMDGFGGETGIVIIGATNKPDVLDPALMRAGRFDRQIYVSKPDVRGREDILKIHARRLKLEPEIDLTTIARGTIGFSGADLENLLNEASFFAIRHHHEAITAADIDNAKDKIMFGEARRSFFDSMNDIARREVAYHEAGHAVVAYYLNPSEPLHKITIVPHGKALGMTVQLPAEERYIMDNNYLQERLAVLMGGRAAEEIFLRKTTSGAANDLAVATKLARDMVCRWGMSELGPIAIDIDTPYQPQYRFFSEETQRVADKYVMDLLTVAHQGARHCLETNRAQVEKLVTHLCLHETLDAEQIKDMLNTLHEPSGADAAAGSASRILQ